MRLAVTLMATVLTVACRTISVDAVRVVQPGEPFVLSVGQTAALDGTNLYVHFARVTGDSRCPTDVTCVWAGDATVLVLATRATVVDTLQLHTGIEPRGITVGEYTIALEGVEPAPRSDRVIRSGDYSATLRVTR